MSVRGIAKWLGATALIRALLQFVAVAAYARVLGPGELGIVAAASIVLNLSITLKDIGVSASIVRSREDPSQSVLSAYFWVGAALGLLISLTLLFLLAPIEKFLRADGAAEVLRIFAMTIFLSSMMPVFVGLLERSHDFRAIAIYEIAGGIVGLGISLFFLWAKPGVYVVALNAAAAAFVNLVLLWLRVKWRPSVRFGLSSTRGMWLFNLHVSGFNLINFVGRNVDAAIISRALGVVALGFYSQAYKIMTLPLQFTTFLAARAMLPKLSSHQADLVIFAQLFQRALCGVAALSFPVMGLLWVLRDEVVIILLGQGWGGASAILSYLAPVGVVQSLVSLTGAVFLAMGQSRTLLLLGLVGALLFTTFIAVGSRWGVEGVACSYLFANVVNFIPCFSSTARLLGLRLKGILFNLLPVAAAAASMIVVAAFVHDYFVKVAVPVVVIIAGTVAISFFVYVLALRKMSPLTFGDWFSFVKKA